jgi:hypothetical protein
MRAASLRKQDDGKTYARVTNFFFPLVIVAATGFVDRYHVFAFAPVDDTNHLLFFGSYGTAPISQKDFGATPATSRQSAATEPTAGGKTVP